MGVPHNKAAFNKDTGQYVPLVSVSRDRMSANVPAARQTIEAYGAVDLMEMVLGEDA